MLVINPLKPFYINKKRKKIRMGNFSKTGKEIEYIDKEVLDIIETLATPMSKNDLLNKITKNSKFSAEEISETLNYLISENFIIDDFEYNKILNNSKYSRQNLFFNLFKDKCYIFDEKMQNKNIVILGLGGIGSNVTILLSRTGFDKFTLIDFDKVEESNLIRQYAYDYNDIGSYKTDSLAKKIDKKAKVYKKNIKIETANDISNIIKKADFVVCTLDKPQRVIRRVINDICVKYEIPVIFAGFSEHIGMIGPFIIPKRTACLNCIDKKMNDVPINNVKIAPSYGPLCAIISAIVVNEIVNYFVEYNYTNLIGKTLMFDISNYKFKVFNWTKKQTCEVCKNYDSK